MGSRVIRKIGISVLAGFQFPIPYVRMITGHTNDATTQIHYVNHSQSSRQYQIGEKWSQVLKTAIKNLDEKFQVQIAAPYFNETHQTSLHPSMSQKQVQKLRQLMILDPCPL